MKRKKQKYHASLTMTLATHAIPLSWDGLDGKASEDLGTLSAPEGIGRRLCSAMMSSA